MVLLGCSAKAPEPPPTPRLVSLTPAITETVFALGAGDLLVGRSDWCSIPAQASVLPGMGSSLTPNLEAIALAHPSGILVDASLGTKPDDLKAISTVHSFPWLTVEQVVGSTRELGKVVGKEAEANALADQIASTLSVTAPEGPVVLLAMAGEGLESGEVWYIKPDSLHGAALHAAGAKNAVGVREGAPMLTLEQVVSLNPDAVMLLPAVPVTPEQKATLVADWQKLETLKAVQQGAVVVVDPANALSVGPSILNTTKALKNAVDGLKL